MTDARFAVVLIVLVLVVAFVSMQIVRSREDARRKACETGTQFIEDLGGLAYRDCGE